MIISLPALRLRFAISSVVLLAGCATQMPPAPAQVSRGDFSAVQRYATTLAEQAIAKNWVKGISIALVDDQRVVWSSGFGYADVAAKQLATADTLYRVGSVAKLFTDTAAMQLVETGQIKLDEPVKAVLPGFSPKWWDASATPVTARMLMTHHSGLPRDVRKSFQSPRPPRFTEEAENFDGYLANRPGQTFSYSNLGLSVLGSMVEKASSTRFEDYMHSAVLMPLGMHHSAFDVAASPDANMAKGYSGDTQLESVPMRDVPAGGLNSSANDLSRFLMMVFAQGQANGKRVLRADSVSEMLRPQNEDVPLDFDSRIGLGWFLQSSATARVTGGGWNASHDGAIDGYRSTLMALPEHKLGVVVLGNSSSGAGVVRTIAAQMLKVALEAKTGIRQPGSDDTESGESIAKQSFVSRPIASDQLASWSGNYSTRLGPVRIHTADNKTLRIDAQGFSGELLERDDGRFGLRYKLLGFLPTPLGSSGTLGFSRRTVEGRELITVREFGRDSLFGEKLPVAALTTTLAPALRKFVDTYCGSYILVDSGDDKVEFSAVRLFEDHGVLMAEVQITGGSQVRRMTLRPISSTQALVLGSLADGGDLIQGITKDDALVELQAMGLRFRKVSSAAL
jgi:CubicO group peptidase (beta-lactamase class C family)